MVVDLMQTSFDHSLWEQEDSKPVSEQVRDNNFRNLQDNMDSKKLRIYNIIAAKPGISSMGILVELNLPPGLNRISGRLTELANPKCYTDKPRYCYPPVIEALIEKDFKPDFSGKMIEYSRYRVTGVPLVINKKIRDVEAVEI
jgi:hypothetical protein